MSNKKDMTEEEKQQVLHWISLGLSTTDVYKLLNKQYPQSTVVRFLRRQGVDYTVDKKTKPVICDVCHKILEQKDPQIIKIYRNYVCSKECFDKYDGENKKTLISLEDKKEIIRLHKLGLNPAQIYERLNKYTVQGIKVAIKNHGLNPLSIPKKEKTVYNYVCKICNTPFTTLDKRRKTCSEQCRNKAVAIAKIKHTNEQKDKAIELKRQGYTNKEIERITGISLTMLKMLFKEHNVTAGENARKNLATAQLKQYGTIQSKEDYIKLINFINNDKEFREILATQGITKAGDFINEKLGIRLNELTLRKYTQHMKRYHIIDELMPIKNYIKSAEFKREYEGKHIADIRYHLINKFPKYKDSIIKSSVRWLKEYNIKYKKTSPFSLQEKYLYDFIKSIYPKNRIRNNDRSILKRKEVDILIYRKNKNPLAIEVDGLFWHSEGGSFEKFYHYKKYLALMEKNVDLFVIYSDEWEQKQDLVKAMIKDRLGIFNGPEFMASDLELVYFDKHSDYNWFFEKYHIDGSAISKFAIGLVTKDTKELVTCMSFQGVQEDLVEIKLFANNYNYKVYGGFSRILKEFKRINEENNLGFKTIIGYSSNRIDNGNIYKNNGFTEITPKNPSIDYWYTDGLTKVPRTKIVRINDPEVLKKYPTEEEQVAAGLFNHLFNSTKKIYKIYGYGNRKWRLDL